MQEDSDRFNLQKIHGSLIKRGYDDLNKILGMSLDIKKNSPGGNSLTFMMRAIMSGYFSDPLVC